MPDYSQGKIYKLTSPHTDLVYIGSTIQNLNKRLIDHLSNAKCYVEGKHTNFVSSFKIIEYGDCKIELVENYPCNSKEELERREREIIEITPNACNKNKPRITNEERLENQRKKYRKLRELGQEKYKSLLKELNIDEIRVRIIG